MRISDWSSDVCSSDLDMAFALHALGADDRAHRARLGHRAVAAVVVVNVDRRVRQRGAEAGDRLPNRGFLVVAGQQDCDGRIRHVAPFVTPDRFRVQRAADAAIAIPDSPRMARAEESRVGKEGDRTSRTRGERYHEKKKTKK